MERVQASQTNESLPVNNDEESAATQRSVRVGRNYAKTPGENSYSATVANENWAHTLGQFNRPRKEQKINVTMSLA